MITRPKNTDTMDDICKMQEELMKNKKSKQNFKPAAQLIKQENSESTSGQKSKSLFARQRNIKQSKQQQTNENDSELNVLKDVIERKYDMNMEIDYTEILPFNNEEEVCPFPKTININLNGEQEEGQSLFSQLVKNDAFETKTNPKRDKNLSELHEAIDDENVKFLQSMSKEEIMRERERLLKSLDPGIVNFLRNKRKSSSHDDYPVKEKTKSKEAIDKTKLVEKFPPLEILQDENAPKWLNMNLVEPEKLEWTKNIESMNNESIKGGSKFEARFDWKGFLLPYNFKEGESNKDDRELFLHGDEPNRPGYTLQELFRLARANVLQQRTSSLNAIAGILNIYSQGYYDKILELPLSKIFFFLRFAVDENILAIIQPALRGIAVLFYNETDETLLDAIYETPSGYFQPLLNNKLMKDTSEKDEDIESEFKELNLNEDNNLISCNFNDDIEGNDNNSISDFHLAETNLVECLVRTNIIERIAYILLSMQPNQCVIEYCAKILIRISRDTQQKATTVLNKLNLMKSLVQHLSSKTNLESSYLIIKLFRIIGSYNFEHMQAIQNHGIVEIAINFITIKEDLNMNLIKLQIECFRFLRLYFHVIPDESKYNQLLMPLRYLIEWHYQFLEFSISNHFIIRTHASALLHLLSRSNITVSFAIFGEIFKMCCCKWYHIAYREGVTEFSQRILLSTLLDVASNFIKFGPEFFYDFLDEYFIKFMKSDKYKKIEEALLTSSLLFKHAKDRRNVHKPLINLGTVIQRGTKTLPNLILSQEYSAYFIQSVLTFIKSFDNQINVKNLEYHKQLSLLFFMNGGVEKYLTEFCSLDEKLPLSSNWFAIIEIELIYSLLKTSYNDQSLWLFKVSFNLLTYLNLKQHPLALDILDKFIFHKRFYEDMISKEELDRWKYIFNGIVMSDVKERTSKYLAVIDDWNEILLNNIWTYSLLLFLLYKIDIHTSSKRIVEIDLKEIDLIKTTLKFNQLLNRKDINKISQDDRLMHLMLVYFGEDLNFLDADIKNLIKKEMDLLKKGSFNFDSKLNGEKSFENLYKMFLETFQANGYGDNLFSSIVMIPLAQKYDVKWRKLIWSEYAMVLKFIKCTETDLLVELKEYLCPIESDESLIKCYRNALQKNYLNRGSIPWIIADYHVTHFSSSDKLTGSIVGQPIEID